MLWLWRRLRSSSALQLLPVQAALLQVVQAQAQALLCPALGLALQVWRCLL